MQRLKSSDRGSSAVVVALFMIVIVAVAAIAIDVGAMHAARQQLQAGADAGALAVAQECARTDCTSAANTAQTMADANFNGDGARGTVADLDESAGMVRIETDTLRKHWFAPIIGIDSTHLHVGAGARWGYPTGGTALLPVTLSFCELISQEGVDAITNSDGDVIGVEVPNATPTQPIKLVDPKDKDCRPGRSDMDRIPGGFGWLHPTKGCHRTIKIGDEPKSSTGKNAECSDAELRQLIGKTVFLPIFDAASGQGSNGQYHIFGFAAFTLAGYKFPSMEYHHEDLPESAHCKDNGCLTGSFTNFAELSGDFDFSPTAPNLGATVVALTE